MEKDSLLRSVLDELRNDEPFARNVTHWEVVPPRTGNFAPFPDELNDDLRRVLHYRGINHLYSHQANTYRHIRGGDNVVLVTPTASGKTLSYNLPILQNFLHDATANALYLFPTKALSHDQQAVIEGMVADSGIPVPTYTYDGDTPASIRSSVRERSRIVITNPDMLHTGILPNHPRWIRFINGLRYVVIDELHTYRGVFGSHLANVIRRLKRITAFYGAKPRFICCSATIGNPLELARSIIEEDAVLIDHNGAPQGEQHILLYNPPLLDPIQGIRRSVVNETSEIAGQLLRRRINTIVFARSRTRTELIATYIRQYLRSSQVSKYNDVIASYRGGYLPKERRRIEKGLRDASLLGVVSTNALELGIDIGGLDASVIAGFPGTIASYWQQAGRAGRMSAVSLSILVASASPIDQFVIRHPEYLFGTSPESGHVDPDNIHILLDQLKCAVFELPYHDGDATTLPVRELLEYLDEQGVIHHVDNSWYWSDRSYPAEQISLRTSTPENIVIANNTDGERHVIGEMDLISAKALLYDEAVYMHGGEQYIVKRLDLEKKIATVEKSAADYFTNAINNVDIKLLHRDHVECSPFGLIFGYILVKSQPQRFKKIRFHTHENLGYGEIHLPEDEMHTRSVAVLFSEKTVAGRCFAMLASCHRHLVMSRLGYLLRNVAPVFLLCDVRDLGVAERMRDPDLGAPVLYLYDVYPGGSGLAEGFRASAEQILQGCRSLVAACACERGCPSCIGPFESRNDVNPKELMVEFLDGWLAEETTNTSTIPLDDPDKILRKKYTP